MPTATPPAWQAEVQPRNEATKPRTEHATPKSIQAKLENVLADRDKFFKSAMASFQVSGSDLDPLRDPPSNSITITLGR